MIKLTNQIVELQFDVQHPVDVPRRGPGSFDDLAERIKSEIDCIDAWWTDGGEILRVSTINHPGKVAKIMDGLSSFFNEVYSTSTKAPHIKTDKAEIKGTENYQYGYELQVRDAKNTANVI